MRHEIDDRHLAVLGLEDSFEHQGARTVATVDLAYAANGSDQPSAVLRSAQEGGEACRKSKRGRQSQSIDPSRATKAAVWQSPMRA